MAWSRQADSKEKAEIERPSHWGTRMRLRQDKEGNEDFSGENRSR